MRVLHLAPHPDDEAIGAPAMLSALREEGHTVDNLALSFGRGDEARREDEARLCCQRLGFNLLLPEPPPHINGIGSREDFLRGEREVMEVLFQIIGDYDLVVSPSHWDVHPAHEVVGRAVRRILPEGITWWQWGIWSDLPFPSLLYGFGEREMKAIEHALSAHVGQIERNNFMRLLIARCEALATLGPEKVFHFGDEGIAEPYAEVVTALQRQGDVWNLSEPALFRPEEVVFVPGLDISAWIESDSPRYEVLFS